MVAYSKVKKRRNFIRRLFNLPGLNKINIFKSPGVFVQERD